jgi:hypothetical protein
MPGLIGSPSVPTVWTLVAFDRVDEWLVWDQDLHDVEREDLVDAPAVGARAVGADRGRAGQQGGRRLQLRDLGEAEASGAAREPGDPRTGEELKGAVKGRRTSR